MTDKVKSLLDSLLEQFRTGNIPESVAISMFPRFEVPCNKWSMLNRLLVMFSGTSDARGFRQWQQAGRNVKKGAKAIHILVPWIKKTESDNENDQQVLAGFMLKPVFRAEDTEGAELDYQQLTLPDFPLLYRAKEWGIKVIPISGNKDHYGYYSQMNKEIGLATEEECIFFHELVHFSDGKNIVFLKGGQDPLQEIVAELGSLALCNLVGKDGNKYLGNSYRYIETYANKLKISPYTACIKVISRVEKALNLILGKETDNG